MADEEGKDNAGAGAGGQGKEGIAGAGEQGKPGGGASAAGKGQGDGAEKTYSQADLDAAVAAARQDARKAKPGKTNTQKTTGKKDEGGEEEAAEVIEARKRAEAAEAQLRVRDARDAVETAAKTAGFTNPAKIYRLVKDELSFDDSGKPENVKDLIAIAKRDFPEELSTAKGNGSADGGAGTRTGAAATNMNDFIRRAAGRA